MKSESHTEGRDARVARWRISCAAWAGRRGRPSRCWRRAGTETKNLALDAAAQALQRRRLKILEANDSDMRDAGLARDYACAARPLAAG